MGVQNFFTMNTYPSIDLRLKLGMANVHVIMQMLENSN